jgi:hypothetical protein
VLGLTVAVQSYTLWGLNGFSASFPLFFCRRFCYFTCFGAGTRILGTFFVSTPDILFPFSQKPKVLAGKPVVQFFKERFAG